MDRRQVLLDLRRQIEDIYTARLKAVNELLEALDEIEKPSKPAFQLVQDQTRKRRVRGVLAAVRELIPELPDVFDRKDVLERLKQKNQYLASRVTLENLRGTLRSLAKTGEIELRAEATRTQPTRYGVRRAA